MMNKSIRIPLFDDRQIKQLLGVLNKNQYNFLSYRELFIHTFGQEKGE